MPNTLAIISILINLGALVFVGLQVRLAARVAEDSSISRTQEWKLDRQRSTMDFYESSLARRAVFQTELPPAFDRVGIERFIDESTRDPVRTARIREYLSFHELLATGVNLGVLDEEVIARFAGPPIIHVWRHYEKWINSQRALRKDDQAYEQLEDLATKLEGRFNLAPL